ncbi:amino acid ABC transporter substrate-binding protein, partial [Mesorhizobium sp. M8A.F.Ca.ET.023.02.2.1]
MVSALLLASATLPAKADTFDIVKQRGSIICGVSQG